MKLTTIMNAPFQKLNWLAIKVFGKKQIWVILIKAAILQNNKGYNFRT